MSKKELMPHVRNFCCGLTLPQMERELVVSVEMDTRGARLRAECINDYINECICKDHAYRMYNRDHNKWFSKGG